MLLAVLAALIVWLATPFGIGVNPDSTVYLDAARSLLDGRGLVALTGSGEFKPLTHYPPLYSGVLALFTRVGLWLGNFSIETAARVLNSLLFGANVLLVGIALRSYARDSYWLPILGALLTLAAPDIVSIHTFALSEGLFIFLGLGALVALSRFMDTDQRAWLFASAAATALALLTRYVGVTLAMTGVVVLLLVNGRPFRRRCFDALMFGMMACAPMMLWAVRNMPGAEGMTDREFAFHPVRLRQLAAGFSTVSTWLFLGKVRTDVRVVFFVIEIVAAVVFVIYLVRRSRVSPLDNKDHRDHSADEAEGSGKNQRMSALLIILGFFMLTYAAFLIFTALFVDADTVLDLRALVPVHVAAIVLVSGWTWRRFASFREGRQIRIVFVVFAIALLGSYSIRLGGWLIEARKDGQGYASRAWKESRTIASVRNLPAGVPIYSNGYEAIYYLTQRPAIYLPEKVIHGTGRENQNYAAEVERMGTALKERDGRLIYFNTFSERWFLPSESDLKGQLPLTETATATDGSIYKLNAASESRPAH